MRGGSSYDYVLSDEIQDMTGRVLASMNSRAKHVIVAGDENQSIYDSDPQFREPTVTPTQITALLNSRDFELGIIHRLSSSIIAAVQMFLPNMNIFTAKIDMNKRTTQIRLCTATSMSDEVKYVMREAQKAVGVGDTAAILIPSHGSIISFVQTALSVLGKPRWNAQLNNYGKVNYNALNQYLASQDVKMQYVGNGYGSFTETSGKICLMTYHSSKGLDFDNVFLPGLNQSLYINSSEILSRTLFMVAMTRSRKNLYLTHSGTRSAYLSNFAGECIKINIHDALNGQTINAGTNNIFGI
jgi:hypothetical protein